MKRLRRIADSITFRLALVYTLVFGLSVGGLFYFLFWATIGFATQQVEAQIDADVAGFSDSYFNNGILGLITSVRRRADRATNRDGVYLLVDSLGQPLAGNLTGWPAKMQAHDLWLNFTINDMRTATPETAEEMHAEIRRTISGIHGEAPAAAIRVLYGGSVKPDNIASLMAKENIDGALVGGASLDAASFASIIKYTH